MLTKLYQLIPRKWRTWYFTQELKREAWRVYLKTIRTALLTPEELKQGMFLLAALSTVGLKLSDLYRLARTAHAISISSHERVQKTMKILNADEKES